jgi:hypothetical protein
MKTITINIDDGMKDIIDEHLIMVRKYDSMLNLVRFNKINLTDDEYLQQALFIGIDRITSKIIKSIMEEY